MLTLKNITKNYVIGDGSVTPALCDVSICFRKNEFVSILGPSGCGKTTLLNIIGGLDQYTSGDLVIKGVSTKKYRDGDWDTYRNHSIGFVFQSYNLIPHQTVLSNVELALTLSGVSKAERRARAIEALEKVGLGDQIKKKPNQMSGGQMQRVAIARALVNNPDILLADEPTGALDTTTSVQIMEILKEISKDKLIIMVTHNPDLAEQYSTRIVKLRDGVVIDDSNPCTEEEAAAALAEEKASESTETCPCAKKKTKKKTSMSFLTALSLSLNNLMTKKARTFLTSFAGSIGIIGIALILALSNGIQAYIDQVQEDTLSTYPLSILSEEQDYGALLSAMTSVSESADREVEDGTIYVDDSFGAMLAAMSTKVTNDLEKFMAHLEANRTTLDEYLLDIKYTYDFDMQIYSEDGKTRINPTTLFDHLGGSFAGLSTMMEASGMQSQFNVFSEMINNRELLETQYDLIDGEWAESYNEVMLVLNKSNSLTNMVLYILGIEDQSEAGEVVDKLLQDGEYTMSDRTFTYDDFRGLSFYIVPGAYFYDETGETFTVDGKEYKIYKDLREEEDYDQESFAKEHGVKVTITGLLRPAEGAVANSISGAVAYNHSLTDYILALANETDIVKTQRALADYDLLTGLEFDNGQYKNLSAEEKGALLDEYISGKKTVPGAEDPDATKIEMILHIMSSLSEDEEAAFIAEKVGKMTDEEKTLYLMANFESLLETNPELYKSVLLDLMKIALGDQYGSYAAQFEAMSAQQLQQMIGQMGGMGGGTTTPEQSHAAMQALFAQIPADSRDGYVAAMVAAELRGNLASDLRENYTDEQLLALFDERYAELDAEAKAALYDRYMPVLVSTNTYDDVMFDFGG
ncbi:MAG: ABC transporter ATP-binding protein, partial [Clostridia bacterium]|nr:ABC transporter ATP-binding protein [Clostridia bacterium]